MSMDCRCERAATLHHTPHPEYGSIQQNGCKVYTQFQIYLSLGSEADIVICLLSHTHTPSLRRDLDFLYNRPRLNVAISRAKTISIVISSTGVLNPPIEALVDADNLEGYAYLKAFEERAWSFDLAIGIQNNFESPKALEGYCPLQS